MIFTKVCNIYNVVPDRKGEAHIPCPNCGKRSQRGQTHFSFSEKGGHCFVCGYDVSLKELGKRNGIHTTTHKSYARFSIEDPVPNWKEHGQRFLKIFKSHRDLKKHWQNYKPVTNEMISEYDLGFGKLPMSRCNHYRLIIPIFNNGKIVDFRGRANSCDCIKWLSPKGMKVKDLPLYNYHRIKNKSVVFIVENPIDAILINNMTTFSGVATYSTNFWNESWITMLSSKNPDIVIVAFDNDLGGNGGAKSRRTQIEKWQNDNPSCTNIPQANGPKILKRLKYAGFKSYLYDWKNAEPKMDFGILLKNQTLIYSPYNYSSNSKVYYAY